MQLGETIATYDVALALRGESGKFDVTSPTGEIYHVTCKSGHSITNLHSKNGGNPQPFVIRKVAEPVTSAQKAIPNLTEAPAQGPLAKAPFLISSDEDDLLSERTATAKTSDAAELEAASAEICDLELVYEEAEPTRQQHTVCVSLRSEFLRNRHQLTNACTTFNQFDAEIRRLHAQLDEIRYRARKKFYQAREIAAGA